MIEFCVFSVLSHCNRNVHRALVLRQTLGLLLQDWRWHGVNGIPSLAGLDAGVLLGIFRVGILDNFVGGLWLCDDFDVSGRLVVGRGEGL